MSSKWPRTGRWKSRDALNLILPQGFHDFPPTGCISAKVEGLFHASPCSGGRCSWSAIATATIDRGGFARGPRLLPCVCRLHASGALGTTVHRHGVPEDPFRCIHSACWLRPRRFFLFVRGRLAGGCAAPDWSKGLHLWPCARVHSNTMPGRSVKRALFFLFGSRSAWSWLVCVAPLHNAGVVFGAELTVRRCAAPFRCFSRVLTRAASRKTTTREERE